MACNYFCDGVDKAPQRSLFNALGMTKEEMDRPLVGIVSSYNEIVPGHMNIDKIVEAVKMGVAMAGGTPVVFPAIAVCDGIAMGHRANQVHTKFRVSAQASFLMSSIQRFMTRSSLLRMRTLSRQATSSLKQRVSSLVFHQAQHLKPLRYFQRDLRTRARLSLHFSLIQVKDIFQQHFSRTNFSNIQNRKRADSQAS